MNDHIEYRDIPGFEGYRVGSDGTVWSRWRPRAKLGAMWHQLSTTIWNNYRNVVLRKNGKRIGQYVHRLVLLAFRGPPQDGQEGCHNNGIKNDCRLENLRWDSRSANMQDKRLHGSAILGERNHQSKMTVEKVLAMRSLYTGKRGQIAVLARQFSIGHASATKIINRQSWSHVQ